MKLEQDELNTLISAKNQFDKIASKVDNRITDVLKIICKCLKTELEWWDYYGDHGGHHADSGSLMENFTASDIALYTVTKNDSPLDICDAYDYVGNFKTKFLTMDDEAIRMEVQAAIDEELKIAAKERAKEEAKKKAKSDKKKKVLAKLSTEDKKILGIKG